jgi:hypothetical protein
MKNAITQPERTEPTRVARCAPAFRLRTNQTHLSPYQSWLEKRGDRPARWVTAICIILLTALPRLHARPSLETNAEPAELEPSKLAGGGPVAARALANQINNPTAPVTLVQLRDVLAPSVPGFEHPGNVLQLEPVFPVFPSRLLPFEQLVKMTLPFPTTPNPGSQTGLGDFSLFDVVSISQSWGKWGFGPALVFPTATSTALGQGNWQAGPAVALIYTGIKNLTVGAVAQNPISYAGSPDRPGANALAITPTLTYNLPNGWFAGYSDFNWSFDWKNGGAATIPLGLQAGKIFKVGKVPVSLSLEGAWIPVRPSDTPEYLVCLELTVIFKTFRGRH